MRRDTAAGCAVLFSNVELVFGCRQVRFWTGIYGTFRQSLVLDFSADTAALAQHMTVDCQPQPVCDELTSLNKQLVTDKTEAWVLANKTIIPYKPR